MDFTSFNFHPDILEGLVSMGYQKATPIQEKAIPVVQQKKDLIACAQTGTGKTAAYVLPVLDLIKQSNQKGLQALILAPTRELALQIDQQIEGLAYFSGISSIPVYGGGDASVWDQQKKAIDEGVEIIIATPGRLISHLNSGLISLKSIRHLILDEADRMLDMGFYEDIMRIIRYLPEERQTVLFSATMPPKIRSLAQSILKNPEEINIAISKPAEGINQQAYLVYDNQKMQLLKTVLTEGNYQSIIIFASTKEIVKKMENEVIRIGFNAKAFHSDLEQSEREILMRSFKSRNIPVLIGTDVLSRGIDVDGIDLVVNYDVPPDPEDYVHRIGRTARADKTGTAITFINDKDQQKFFRIESLIGRDITKVPLPAALGEAPLYEPEKKVRSEHGHGGGKKKNFRGKFSGPKKR